ncbi:S-adenosyl-L-methionine-dependent methyltransferase [Hyaloraphidium curvatum]|nr:S-adenosyl-L-methionine-dependent methyltransferase [Hyaloraphidium curvatum]
MGRIPFLLQYPNVHRDFWLPEFQSIAEAEGVELAEEDVAEWKNAPPDAVFVKIHLSSREEAIRLTRRSVLVKLVVELWAEGDSYDELHAVLKARIAADPGLLVPYMERSFRFNILAFGATLSMEQQRERVESLSYLGFRGPIDLRNAESTFVVAEDYGDWKHLPAQAYRHVFFGVQIGTGDREARQLFDLKKREYLGTTSMDAELSLVMANMGKVRPGCLVLDPFVGTGSILVTSAYFGGLVCGSDIDGRQIRGGTVYEAWKHTEGKDLRTNVQQYQCAPRVVDTVVCDIAHHPWRTVGFFDAIITDPPYGVRAGAKKIGKRPNYREPPPSKRPPERPRYPATVPYEMDDVVADLVEFAAVYLAVGGRLVFWMPTVEEGYQPSDIRANRCLRLRHISCQPFNNWARFLVTFEKVTDYVVQDGRSYLSTESVQNTINFRNHILAAEQRNQRNERRQRRANGGTGIA